MRRALCVAIDAGRELLSAGNPRDALLPLDRAVKLDSESAAAWFWRGRAAFETAATDRQPLFFYRDALDNLERAVRLGYGPEAMFAASRAARMATEPQKALEYATGGMQAIAELDPRPDIEPLPERTLAEASFGAYLARKQSTEDASGLFTDTEAQLGRLAARTPQDSWVWLQLANLYEWEERTEDARRTLNQGIDISPSEVDLHNRLILVARKLGGSEEVHTTYATFRDKYPENALGYWYPAFELYEQGLTAYSYDGGGSGQGEDPEEGNGEGNGAGDGAGEVAAAGATTTPEEQAAKAIELFRQAEASFVKCREIEPDYTASAKGYEVMCRAGIGWCQYKLENLQEAKDAFLSMEDLLEGGLLWEQTGRLGSGTLGLEFVLNKYSQSTNNADAIVNAAAIADYLHSYTPEDGDKANNAGFFNRDAAVVLENLGFIDNYNAKQEGSEARSEEERRELAERSARMLSRARELMQRSYSAYKEASRLNPEDVRVINDTALVMTYYIRTNVEEAERYLRRAVELGAEQLETTTLEGEDLVDLQEAWGDAHQNLGVLYLTLRNEPEKAREWFEKCVEIGPRPRAPRDFVRDGWIPACDGDEEAMRAVLRQVWDKARYD